MRTFVDSITHWDLIFLNTIFGLNGRRLISAVMPWISHSANGYYYPAIPLFLYLIDPHTARSFLLAGIMAFVIELPLYKALKNWIKRERPCEVLFGVYPRVSPSDLFSFPSGHTAAAFLIATLVCRFFPVLLFPVYVWALLVGMSRIYLGVHYPSDILAGLFIGVSCALVGIVVFG
ncbi:MAG: phosphatase PAP2 family protein [Deltaproteobacteria bacterium]|nr:phosphatase PAP2 family protein [Deltaproteobacteria bacterium]